MMGSKICDAQSGLLAAAKELDFLDDLCTPSLDEFERVAKIKKKLGEGAYADVYKVCYEGQYLALKVMREGSGRSGMIEFLMEAKALKACRGMSSVVRFHRIIKVPAKSSCLGNSKPRWAILMELCDKGTLGFKVGECMQSMFPTNVYNIAQALTWSIQAAEGLRSLHSLTPSMAHRDVKSHNILLKQEGGQVVAKISDLGLHVVMDMRRGPPALMSTSMNGLMSKPRPRSSFRLSVTDGASSVSNDAHFMIRHSMEAGDSNDGPTSVNCVFGESSGLSPHTASEQGSVRSSRKNISVSNIKKQVLELESALENSLKMQHIHLPDSYASSPLAPLATVAVDGPSGQASARMQQIQLPWSSSSCPMPAQLVTAGASGVIPVPLMTAGASSTIPTKTAGACGMIPAPLMSSGASGTIPAMNSCGDIARDSCKHDSSGKINPVQLLTIADLSGSCILGDGSTKSMLSARGGPRPSPSVAQMAQVMMQDMLADMLAGIGEEEEMNAEGMEVHQLALVFNLTGKTGSPFYMAPEIHREQPYNTKVDVYSFGCVMYELFSRTLLSTLYSASCPDPVVMQTRFPEQIASGWRPERPNSMANDIWELISQCWDDNPMARPDMGTVVERLQQMFEERDKGSATKRDTGDTATASEGITGGSSNTPSLPQCCILA